MNRVLSFRDLRLITELSKFTEIELLNPENDAVVNKYLAQLGFDLDYGIVYEPSKHRDMQGNVGVGYRVVGELDINRAVVGSFLCSLEERLAVAAYLDPSFIKEVAPLLGTRIDPKALQDSADADWDDAAYDYTEPDCDMIMGQIEMLRAIRDNIRGTPYNEAGDIKAPNDAKE